MDSAKTKSFVEGIWDDEIIPQLVEYIKIPNESPAFDPDWVKHGHMDKAINLIADWCRQRPIEGLQLEVVQLEGRTPLIFMEIPGAIDNTVMLYGHMDKQPPMVGWDDDLGPWKPVIKDGKLYGRGGADDGYSAYASLTAIEALQREGVPHARCVIIIEGCEESGSYDLPYYVEHLGDRIGTPSLVVCLDSGAGNYDQLWSTTSLRGMLIANLKVELISEGVHSGDGSGVVASSFRVARQLLSRLEDEESGIIIDDFQVEIPEQRRAQAAVVADVMGDEVFDKFPLHEGVRPLTEDKTELVLNRTWRPALSITGQEGIPSLLEGGNVLRPQTTLKLSLRLPPTLDCDAAGKRLKELLESDPPYGAKVTVELDGENPGWNAPALADWLGDSLNQASETYFGQGACFNGEGGSIPFIGMLGEKFPDAQFLITGLLGPHSNAHGPNEFLHIQCGKTLTCCVAHVLADHHNVFKA
ncbi:MAG: acetylornithine deacetylase/succinyl-diaminopimelate desuccinylase-like protein [Planctomycetota bacterium]|jgi:acetylornithine deacetylase/succinyl-diaminopimelate desuccinylase-like protein